MSGQNTSSAVMQQRSGALDAFDDFPTPMWATRVVTEYLREEMLINTRKLTVKEPCANRGYMARPMQEAFGTVLPSDIYDYGVGYDDEDYLFSNSKDQIDGTVFNPPFVLAERFIEHALKQSRRFVAVFVRSAFLEGMQRHKNLYSINPPSRVLHFAERVIIHKGIVRDPDVKYWNPKANKDKGKMQKPSSATAYCWMIFDKHRVVGVHQERSENDWIAPCRKRLTRPGDYDVLGSVAA